MRYLAVVAMLCFLPFGTLSTERSPEWQEVRKEFLQEHPKCALCGMVRKDNNVHHIKPFHLHPELELDKNNLITLCVSKYAGFNCHLIAGHSGNFRYENPWVLEDIAELKEIVERTGCAKYGCLNNQEFLLATKKMKARTKKYMCEVYGKCGKAR